MPKFVEEDNEPIEVDLKREPTPGATAVTFDATGMTLSLVIKARDKVTTVVTTTKVEWADQANSRARFNRASGDILKSKSPYYAHWVVTDGSMHSVSWPEGDGDQWVIEKRGEA